MSGKHYLVRRKVFATLPEACAYADDYFAATGIIVAVEETNRKVTHVYRLGDGNRE